ncbi:MAG: hypothetical protein QOE65_2029 [Solirubrobacteraceae bacterium]|jgi:hypothetical protein|nr:hypothetical protein [Solirubrobacteraceae bacterium]
MPDIPLPTKEALLKDIRMIHQKGLPAAQNGDLSAFDAIVRARQRVPGREEMTPKDVFNEGLDRMPNSTMRTAMRERYYVLEGRAKQHSRRVIETAEYLGELERGHAYSEYTFRDRRPEFEEDFAEVLLDLAAAQREASVRVGLDADTQRRMSQLCLCAALQLIADRADDGSWPRTRPEADRDVGVDETPGSVSVTSWAASAIFKVLGEPMAGLLAQTEEFILSHYNEGAGAFGSRHVRQGDTPGFRSENIITPLPRYTASAIKILHHLHGGQHRKLAMGIRYLLLNRNAAGCWGERPGDEKGNLLTTAYVLDALLAIQPDLRFLEHALEPHEWQTIDQEFDRALRNGLDWMAEEQHPDTGGWGYEPGDPAGPWETATVLCFLPQLLTGSARSLELTLRYLDSIERDGGYPAESGAMEASITPTAMVAFGLMRATASGEEDRLRRALDFLAGQVPGDGDAPVLDVYGRLFTMLLGGHPDVCDDDWRAAAIAAMTAHVDARREGLDIDQTIELTLRPVDGRAPNLEPSLRAILAA